MITAKFGLQSVNYGGGTGVEWMTSRDVERLLLSFDSLGR